MVISLLLKWVSEDLLSKCYNLIKVWFRLLKIISLYQGHPRKKFSTKQEHTDTEILKISGKSVSTSQSRFLVILFTISWESDGNCNGQMYPFRCGTSPQSCGEQLCRTFWSNQLAPAGTWRPAQDGLDGCSTCQWGSVNRLSVTNLGLVQGFTKWTGRVWRCWGLCTVNAFNRGTVANVLI